MSDPTNNKYGPIKVTMPVKRTIEAPDGGYQTIIEEAETIITCPSFLLLAQDRLATIVVQVYVELAGALADHGHPAMLPLVEQAEKQLLAMREWQKRNPDRVKLPD